MIKTTKCRRWSHLLFLFLVFAYTIPSVSQESREPVTGILGALPEEIAILKSKMSKKEKTTLMGIQFFTGELKGRNVIITLTGVGKVNAAMTTTLLLDHFQPDEVIFTGIAGGINPELMPGDIIIAEKLAQHDLGVVTPEGFQQQGVENPVNGKRNPTFIPSDPNLVALAQEVACDITLDVLRLGSENHKPKITKGTVITGDVFVASQRKKSLLAEDFGADAVEMEGAAVAQVCFQQNVPFVVVRSLSDNADDRAQRDLEQFYKTAARNSATLTIALLGELADRNQDEATKDPEKSDNKPTGGDAQ
jgi:adenosylhomocysteine nucleosidase